MKRLLAVFALLLLPACGPKPQPFPFTPEEVAWVHDQYREAHRFHAPWEDLFPVTPADSLRLELRDILDRSREDFWHLDGMHRDLNELKGLAK